MERARQKQEVASQKELASRERQQLVALIGNVAHDLKTPLHSFKMEIESLRVALVEVLAHFQNATTAKATTDSATVASPATATATALATVGSSGKSVTPVPRALPSTIESLLKSLSASSEFMMMAINRGIEFAKASGGIRCDTMLLVAAACPLFLVTQLTSLHAFYSLSITIQTYAGHEQLPFRRCSLHALANHGELAV